MMTELNMLVSQLLWVSSAVLCGIYFIFSNTVMPTLARQPEATAIETMQQINRKIQNPAFFLFFFGSGVSAFTLLTVQAMFPGYLSGSDISSGVHAEIAIESLMASGLTLLAFFSTLTINVPLNNRLDRLRPHTPDASVIWRHYLERWVLWNHIRTLATLGSTILMVSQ